MAQAIYFLENDPQMKSYFNENHTAEAVNLKEKLMRRVKLKNDIRVDVDDFQEFDVKQWSESGNGFCHQRFPIVLRNSETNDIIGNYTVFVAAMKKGKKEPYVLEKVEVFDQSGKKSLMEKFF